MRDHSIQTEVCLRVGHCSEWYRGWCFYGRGKNLLYKRVLEVLGGEVVVLGQEGQLVS